MSKINKIARISYSWEGIQRITSPICVLDQMPDLHPTKNFPIIESNIVSFYHCDKNFVYYWIRNKELFPNREIMVLNSHPCEPVIVEWMKDTPNIEFLIIHGYYWDTAMRYGLSGIDWNTGKKKPIPSHIRMINDAEYNSIINDAKYNSIIND